MNKVCLFGDSISKGVIIDELRSRYTMTKKSFANLLSSEICLELSNYSMLGCTITKGRSMLERHRKTLEDCDLVVLEYGGNDSDHNWEEIAANPYGEHLPKTPVDKFEETYREMIEELKGMDKQIIMLNLPPIDEHKYLNWFSKGLDQSKILTWLGGRTEYIYKFHEIYNVRLSRLASLYQIPVIDIRSAFLERKNYSDYLCEDGIHPNEKGHELIAQAICAALPAFAATALGREILNIGA